jgi:hypothetical protein
MKIFSFSSLSDKLMLDRWSSTPCPFIAF